MARIDLTGKPICITGASSGIGRATALRCAEAGMPVALNARREQQLSDVEGEIIARGGRAVSLTGDIADPLVGAHLIERCMSQFGSVYSVFANAGYGSEAPVDRMPEDDIRAMFETNFYGTLHAIRPALPHLRQAGAGHILICSSCVARFPIPYFSIYSATKAAQHHISRAMNLELRPVGIHVSSVHPVGTKTEFFDTARDRSGGNNYKLIDHTSERFMQTPDRVACAILRCLRKPKPEIWTSFAVRYGMSIAGMIPRTSDFFVRRMVAQRRKLDADGHGAHSSA